MIGGSGQLGSALLRQVPGAVGTSRAHGLDLRDLSGLSALLDAVRPDVVVNAAYVPSGPDLEAVTAEAPGRLAAACRDLRFVHVSSDVVFPGDPVAVDEHAPCRPTTVYGAAKLRAEDAVLAAHPGALVVRTSVLWGHPGGGGAERQVATPGFTFYDDEIRCPTHVDDLAGALLAWAGTSHAGPLHLVGADVMDRATFARLLARRLGVGPIASRPTPEGSDRPRHLELVSRHTGPLRGALAHLE